MPRRHLLLALTALVAVLAGVLPAAAAPSSRAALGLSTAAGARSGSSDALPDLDAIDPAVYEYGDAIVEHKLVTTRNGIDQIWIDIIRPKTEPGEKVPTIMMTSPYYNTLGRGWKGEVKPAHQGPNNPFAPAHQALGGGRNLSRFPEWYDEYFVPRGYAYVAMDLTGTRNSSGCQVYGGRKEIYDTVDVIDWIADQPWSNGKVGMTGGSYDGTIAIGAAAEQPMSGRHPNALAAIIPIRAIDRWYDYHFFNGVQSTSHLLTPALFTAALAGTDPHNSGTDNVLFGARLAERAACIGTLGALAAAGYASPYQDARAPFWRERDFVRSAGGFRAATFILHGMFDYNVKTNNAGYLWEALPPHLPKKLWLYNGDHSDPHQPYGSPSSSSSKVHLFPFQEKFVEANHRWWLQFLKGVEAGALDTPTVEVQNGDGTWTTREAFPASTGDLALNLTPDGTAIEGPAANGTRTYRDGRDSNAPAQTVFVTEPFTTDTRISGQIGFDLLMSATGRDATVGIEVVSVPEDAAPTASPTIRTDQASTRPLVVSYGWARAYYRDTIAPRGVSTPTNGSLVEPGKQFRLDFGSLYADITIPAGHRLAFKVAASTPGTFAAGTAPSDLGGTVSIHTGEGASRILLPVVD